MLIVGIQICLTEGIYLFNLQMWVSFFAPNDKAGYPVLYKKKNVLRYCNAQTSFTHTVILHYIFFQTSRYLEPISFFLGKLEKTGFHFLRVFLVKQLVTGTLERETAVPSSVTRVTFRIFSYSRLWTELLARGEIFPLDVSI